MTSSAAPPLSVPCPRCVAGVDEPCERPNGSELAKPHADRVKAAEATAEAARQRADGDAVHRIAGPRFRRLYSAARLELEQRGAWTPLAAEELESVALNMEAAAKARAGAIKNPVVDGSTGQKVANPLFAVALRLDAQALATARALKLTPDTRGTSAPVGDEDVPDEDGPAEERDELAALDELARKRKAKTSGRRRSA